jgi:glycosyltransferase involved in cell wall biosynthesis
MECQYDLSVVLIARNEEKNIAGCIQSVLKATSGLNAEILLVDSASRDRTVEIARGLGIKVLSIPPNADPSAALGRSIGARNSSGRHIQFLDSDMTVDPAWLPIALGYMAAAGQSVAAVAGEIRQNRTANPYREYRRRNLARMTRTDEPGELKSLYGAFMIRADVLHEVGSFDPWLKAHEEGELSDRIRAAGYRIVLLPRLACLHHVTSQEGLLRTLRRELCEYVTAGQFFRVSLRNGSSLSRLWQFKYCLMGAVLAVYGIAAFVVAVALSLLWLELLWLLALVLVGYALLIREERRLTYVFYYLAVYLSSWLFFLRGFLRPPREHRSTGRV